MNSSNQVEQIEIKGQMIPIIVPSIDGQLAVVHLPTIQRLIKALPSDSFEGIKMTIKNLVDEAHTMEVLVGVLEDELAFHKSINMLKEFKMEDKVEASTPSPDY